MIHNRLACALALIAFSAIARPAHAEQSGLIPQGYCAIVIASEMEVATLRSNERVQKLNGIDMWFFGTKKGAVAAVIGAAPMEYREAVLTELSEGGLVDQDSFCMGEQRITGLVDEPPATEFPLFAKPEGETAAPSPAQRDILPGVEQAAVLKATRAATPKFTAQRRTGDLLHGDSCLVNLGEFSGNWGSYDVSVSMNRSGWWFSLQGASSLNPHYLIATQGGTQRSPIIVGIIGRQNDSGWETRFTNMEQSLFERYFAEAGDWRDWPANVVPLSTQQGYQLVLVDDQLQKAVQAMQSCWGRVMHDNQERKKAQCRQEIARGGPPSVIAECHRLLAN
ncbi:hypothetical protein ACEUZ9_004666 [Paracoccus litorisediminis]|uniref:hypothetical protein n=1 Tax=Paracoccus litorisediminis TaxID=2006130 RepID=UPI00373329DB